MADYTVKQGAFTHARRENLTSGTTTIVVQPQQRVTIAVTDNGTSNYNIVAYLGPGTSGTRTKVVLYDGSAGGDAAKSALNGFWEIGVEVTSGDVTFEMNAL